MLTIILLIAMWGSLAVLILNNLTSLGFLLYNWSNGTPLAEALWSAFQLWITLGFLSGIIFLMSLIYLKMLK